MYICLFELLNSLQDGCLQLEMSRVMFEKNEKLRHFWESCNQIKKSLCRNIFLCYTKWQNKVYIYLNDKFSHALIFWYKWMHRNYCLRRKRHYYAARDAALAASIYRISYTVKYLYPIQLNLYRASTMVEVSWGLVCSSLALVLSSLQRGKDPFCEEYEMVSKYF